MLEELRENPVKYIKTFAMDIVVVGVALAYIFYQMVSLQATQLNPWVLLARAIIGIICGIIIKQALGENGFSKGYNSQVWIEEESKYNDACNDANEYSDRIDNFYLVIEREKRENYRRNHLQAVRLRYKDWFDKEGLYIGTKENWKKLTLRQKLMVAKCVRVRIYVLNLLSQYSTSSEQDTRKEMTDNRKRTLNITKNTLSAVAVAMVGVYFTAFIKEWNWGDFISALMQVSLWLLFGIVQMYNNFNFVVQDKVSILRKKKELIARFVKGSKQGLYLVSPYEEQEELQQHLVVETQPSL